MKAALVTLLLLALVALAHSEPVQQAAAHHGGSIVLTTRTGSCPAGHRGALDLRPAGARPAVVGGCYRAVEGGVLIVWRGWPGAYFYPRQAFVLRDRDLSWLD